MVFLKYHEKLYFLKYFYTTVSMTWFLFLQKYNWKYHMSAVLGTVINCQKGTGSAWEKTQRKVFYKQYICSAFHSFLYYSQYELDLLLYSIQAILQLHSLLLPQNQIYNRLWEIIILCILEIVHPRKNFFTFFGMKVVSAFWQFMSLWPFLTFPACF